jgi:hypothetical protein
MYKYGTLKHVGVILRKGLGIKGRKMEVLNQTRVKYMHIWKYHNEIPCITTTY